MPGEPLAPGGEPPALEELIGRARSLGELLRANAPVADAERRLPQENLDALAASGLLRLTTPRRYGGYEGSAETLVALVVELAQACPATAWIFNLFQIHAWIAAHLPQAGRDEIWGADSDNRMSGVITVGGAAERVPGGVRISGKWAYCSGILHSTWTMLTVPGPGGAPTFAWVRSGELAVEDTWFVAGMRGTGSNTIVADSVFVPEHLLLDQRILRSGAYVERYPDEPLYRAAMPAFTALLTAPTAIGIARAALDLVLATAPGKPIQLTTYERQRDSAVSLEHLAEAASKVELAGLLAVQSAREIDAWALASIYPSQRDRARIRKNWALAGDLAREAVDELMSIFGSAAFAESSPLSRMWRDIGTCTRHASALRRVQMEAYGRALADAEPISLF